MVDALRDSWRVLEAEGTLVDLRPVSARCPIDSVTGSRALPLGECNATATIEDDRAADRALLEQVTGGWLTPHHSAAFDIHFYWDTTAEMADFLQGGRVPKTVTPSYAAINRLLRAAGDRNAAPARLRCTRHMTLCSYVKTSRR